MRVLGLQGPHQALALFGFFAINFFLRADLDLGQQRGCVVFNPLEHGLEHLEGLALVLVAIVLLRIATQMDALTQIVHGGQMIAPMLIEHAQHDVTLDLLHDGLADTLQLLVIVDGDRIEDAAAEADLVDLRVLGHPGFGIDARVEIFQHGVAHRPAPNRSRWPAWAQMDRPAH